MPWASSLQSLTALSTVQSELVATILCMKETCYTQDLLRELEFKDSKKSASDITPLEHSPSFHNRVHSTDQAPTTTQEVLQRALREWTDRRSSCTHGCATCGHLHTKTTKKAVHRKLVVLVHAYANWRSKKKRDTSFLYVWTLGSPQEIPFCLAI